MSFRPWDLPVLRTSCWNQSFPAWGPLCVVRTPKGWSQAEASVGHPGHG